jgi:hypothetical protein
MPVRHPSALLPGLLGLLLMTGCASQPPQSEVVPDVQIQTQRERYPLSDQTTHLRIENLYGEINVRSLSPGSVGVIASIQQYGKDAPLPRFEFSNEGDRALLKIHYDDHRPRYRGRPGRVDLAVFIPGLKFLELASADDRIQLKNYPGNVTARSRAGRILVSASGLLDLESERGEIRAILSSPSGQPGNRVIGHGLVEVLFPTAADLVLDARASELLSPELGLELADESPDPLHLRSRIGAATGTLDIRGREVYLRPFHDVR